MKPLEKTNAMRILDKEGLVYEVLSYPSTGEAVDGETVAALLNIPPAQVFKTLVTLGPDGHVFVCLLPANRTLDLKAAARHFQVKSLQMEKVKDLKALTGYVRGGCSPIGMKKAFPTVVDSSAADLPWLLVSAGKIGTQLKLSPTDLLTLVSAKLAPLCQEG